MEPPFFNQRWIKFSKRKRVENPAYYDKDGYQGVIENFTEIENKKLNQNFENFKESLFALGKRIGYVYSLEDPYDGFIATTPNNDIAFYRSCKYGSGKCIRMNYIFVNGTREHLTSWLKWDIEKRQNFYDETAQILSNSVENPKSL